MVSFGRKVCIHLVNWAGMVALSRDAEGDALLDPFFEGRNGSPRHMMWHIYHQRNIDSISATAKLAHLAKRKVQWPFIRRHGLIGQDTKGSKQQLVCIPRNPAITILRNTNKLWPRTTCLVEQAEHHNLSLGTMGTRCVSIPKERALPIILVNTNIFSVWLRQPLLAAELYDVVCDQIEYTATMDQESYNIRIGFQPVPPNLININNHQACKGVKDLFSHYSTNWMIIIWSKTRQVPQNLIFKLKENGCLSN